jgi:exodeoxyribonuclease V alpha subunit
MLDLILANKLIKAVPPGAHLLLVGDVDQLPSVGAGEVLRDLLAADAIPRVRLTQVFRQAADSEVVSNAHRINAGRPPVLQQELTPAREGLPERRVGGRVFRIGDKVTQIRNNYDKGVAGYSTAPLASSPPCPPTSRA